jgi:cell division protein ZapA (FtsZ GTPase activity inhibitor)
MNTSKVKKYKVTIFGESYFLLSDESEEQLITSAQLVDSLMRQIADKSQVTDSKRIAVLVALQLASKTFESKEVIGHYQEKSNELLNLIDAALS